MCVCVCACVRACVRACVCVCSSKEEGAWKAMLEECRDVFTAIIIITNNVSVACNVFGIIVIVVVSRTHVKTCYSECVCDSLRV